MDKNNEFVNVFNDLLAEYNLTRKTFSTQSGIPYPTVVGWTNLGRLPDFYALVKIADFFGCSVDYLTGRQNDCGYTETRLLTPAEDRLVNFYRALSPENRLLLIKVAENLK